LKRKAIIVGSSGQDGQLLAEHLIHKDYELTLLGRLSLDITNADKVSQVVERVIPDEIYFLAAYHHSAEDIQDPDNIIFRKSFDIHVTALSHFLESIAQVNPKARLFYASSSHIFSDYKGEIQSENTSTRPENVYAISKYAGMMTCRYYREHRQLFVSCGILYNHESSLRSPNFLSRKVTKAAVAIKRKEKESLILGNLDIMVDWGYAPDYVDAMYRMLQLDMPADYIVATGKLHTVRQLVEIAFNYVGLDYRQYVVEEDDLICKSSETRVGDASRLICDTGWQPTISFEEMIKQLVDAEMSEVSSSSK
jgi:GDPmannose 4,6-dehydratase